MTSEQTPEQAELYAQVEDVPVKTRGRGKTKDDQPDPALPEKKRARRRLVGAVAMTLALVIVLPMVLDAEPKPVADDVIIHIPSKNKPSKLSVDNPGMADTAAAPEKAEATAQAAQVEAPKNTNEKAADKTVVNAADSAVAAKAVTEKTVAAKPAPESEKKTKAAEKKNSDAKSAEVAPKNKVMIQVAALASADKVKELRGKLKKAGFKSVTQKVATEGGERIRVRVGPYASKKEAEKVCPKLNKMKLKCTLVSN